MNIMEKLLPFIGRHWLLVAALVIAIIVLIFIEARSRGTGGSRVSPAEATRLINQEDAVVIDVRDAGAFSSGHIVGAINVPLSDLDQQLTRLEKYRERSIVVVCRLGQSSLKAMNKLQQAGYVKVYSMNGGMQAWKNASMPIVK